YIGIVGFTILVWDHLVTSADEIEFIWQRPKKIFVYLFLLNRYLTPLVFIVNLVAYNLSSWDSKVSLMFYPHYLPVMNQTIFTAEHFVRYEGATTAIGIEIVGLMMLLRVFPMYRNQRPAIAPAVFLLLAWIVVTAWLLSHGEAVPHSDYVHYVSSETLSSGSIASASAWLPLLYDTYVFGLTLKSTLPSIRKKETGHVVRTLFADGLLYYSVICTINLVLTIMIIRAHPGVKNIAAQYAHLHYSVTMMSRITLNLRKQVLYGPSPHHSQVESIMMSTRNDTISTPSGGVVALSRLRSHSVSSAARAESSNRARSGSASSIVSPVRTITFAENPSSATRLSTIFSATNTPTTLSPMSGSPVSEHANWPSASNSDQRNTADIV
ncbi:hypothetical protein EDB19DRAFT_1630814, partial [Suillus lakei]